VPPTTHALRLVPTYALLLVPTHALLLVPTHALLLVRAHALLLVRAHVLRPAGHRCALARRGCPPRRPYPPKPVHDAILPVADLSKEAVSRDCRPNVRTVTALTRTRSPSGLPGKGARPMEERPPGLNESRSTMVGSNGAPSEGLAPTGGAGVPADTRSASGYRSVMSTHETAPSLGQTGGLPGGNAVPAAAELAEDEAAGTIDMAEVAPPEDTAENTEERGA
jgi:hypothetical protein